MFRRGHGTQFPAVQSANAAIGPHSGIPNFGGRAPDSPSTTESQWGVDKVPTPREMVGILNQHVVGQAHAKKILSVGVHNHYKRVSHDLERQRIAQLAAGAAAASASTTMPQNQNQSPKTHHPAVMPLSGSILPGDPERYLASAINARTDPQAVSTSFSINHNFTQKN